MLILPKLQAPNVPLFLHDNTNDIQQINSYLQTLIGYFYECREEVIGVPSFQALVGVGVDGAGAAVRADLWPDAVTTTHMYYLPFDSTYAGQALTLTLARRAGAAAGTASMSTTAYRFRDGAAFTLITSQTTDFTPGDTATHYTSIIIPVTNILAGDILRIDIQRTGGAGPDTLAAIVANDGLIANFS